MMIFSIILQVLLGIGFLMFGIAKFRSPEMVEGFKHFGYPGWFRIFTGLIELVVTVLMIIGIWNMTSAAWGGLLVVATMIGAILTHIKIKDTLKGMIMPIVLLILGFIVVSINFGSLLG